MLCFGFTVSSLAWVAFAIGPAVVHRTENGAGSWAALTGVLAGWAVLAVAPFVRGRHGAAPGRGSPTWRFAAGVWLLAIWLGTRAARPAAVWTASGCALFRR